MDEWILRQRRLKIIGISIPADRPLNEEEIVECYIENPFQQTPFRLSLDRMAFFIDKGKVFYYLDSFGKEININIYPPTVTRNRRIQTITDTSDSLLHVPLVPSQGFANL